MSVCSIQHIQHIVFNLCMLLVYFLIHFNLCVFVFVSATVCLGAHKCQNRALDHTELELHTGGYPMWMWVLGSKFSTSARAPNSTLTQAPKLSQFFILHQTGHKHSVERWLVASVAEKAALDLVAYPGQSLL